MKNILYMDIQINNMENQQQLDLKWNCLICDQSNSASQIGLSNVVLPKSRVSLEDSLVKVLKNGQVAVSNLQSHNVCDVCLNLFDDLELLESQCSSLRNTLVSGLRKTCHLYDILLEDTTTTPTTTSIGCQTDQQDLTSDFLPIKVKLEDDIPVRPARGRRKTERKVKGKRRKSEEPISELSETDHEESNQYLDSETESKPNVESDIEKQLTYESTSRGKTYTRKKHPCKLCKRLFKRPGEVKNHMLVYHMGKNPNQCALCNKTFNSRNGLYVHLKRTHNIEYTERMDIVNQKEVDTMFDEELILKQTKVLNRSDPIEKEKEKEEEEEERNNETEYDNNDNDDDDVSYGKENNNSSEEESDWNEQKNKKKRKNVKKRKTSTSSTPKRGRGRPRKVKKSISETDEGVTDYEESRPSEPDNSEYETDRPRNKYTRKKHPCKFCNRLFRRPGELKNHVLVSHMGKNPNQCAFCNKTFNTRNGLYVHLKRLHNVEYSDRMEIVNNSDTKDLDKDLLVKQKEILEMGDQMSLDETKCKDGLIRSKENLGVVSVKCLNEDGTIEDEEFVKNEPGEETRRGRKKKKTRRSRTGERFTMPLIHACDQCGKKWRTLSELNAHIQTHSDLRPYVCEICGQGYKMKKALLVHVGMHKGIHPFTCHYCKKSFTQKIGLKKHMNIHMGTKMHTCDICGKSFIHKFSYKFHMFCHKGERPVKCEVCGLGLLSKSHLSTHKLVHTGEKPFDCNVCEKRFAKKWNLKVHRKKLHGLDDIIHEKIIPGDAKMLQEQRSLDEKNLPPPAGTGGVEEKPTILVGETVIQPPPGVTEQPGPYKCTLCPFYSMQKPLLEQHWDQEHSRYNLTAAYSSYDQFNIGIPPS